MKPFPSSRFAWIALVILLLPAACKSMGGGEEKGHGATPAAEETRHGPPEGKGQPDEGGADAGGGGVREVVGTDGDDDIHGSPGVDLLGGESGNDTISGDGGDDELSGGKGDDHLLGGPGNDKINGGPGNDILNGGDGEDKLRGGEGDDKLHGNDGNDFMYGGEGADLMEGGPGEDMMEGNDGDDVVVGGTGKDRMLGNEGADTFLYRAGHGDGSGDVIEDFNPAEGDKLDLSEMLARDKYAGDGSEASLKTWLRVSGNVVEYDPSGKGADFKPLVELGRPTTIPELLKGGQLIIIAPAK